MEVQEQFTIRRTLVALAVVALIVVGVLLAAAAFGLVSLGNDDSPSASAPTTVPSQGTLLISVMDVGQAQCVVVIAPSGGAMVIDASRSQERIEEDVVPYLRAHGVTQIDYVVMSHPDQDHIGGLPKLLELMPVGSFVDPVIPTSNQTYAETLQLVDELGINPVKGRRDMTFDLGNGVQAELLWPVDPLLESGGEPETNANSIVVMIRFGAFSMLIPGDAEAESEEGMLERERDDDLQADVLVVGHHGSNTSSTGAFLDAVRPNSALISAGFDNQFGHPHDEVIRRLRLRGIEIFRTDMDGTIEVRSDGTDTFQITTLGTENER